MAGGAGVTMVDYPVQISFAAGELSPGLDGRVDLGRYGIGLRRAENVFVHPQGGVSNRAGTRFVGEAAAGGGKLFRFVFNRTESHVLSFGENIARVFDQGALVDDGGAVYEFATPYTADESKQLSMVQSADVIYIAHPNHMPHKLERRGLTDWQFVPLDFSIATSTPTLTGAFPSRPQGVNLGTYYVACSPIFRTAPKVRLQLPGRYKLT